VKDPESKRAKKKDKQSAQDITTGQKDDDASVEILLVTSTKDKKKKKSKKTHSSTTWTAPEISILKEQLGNAQGVNDTEPQGVNKGIAQDVLQGKIFDHNNESSNSCFQPPPVMVSLPFLSVFIICY
jgi:hypothetical protein